MASLYIKRLCRFESMQCFAKVYLAIVYKYDDKKHGAPKGPVRNTCQGPTGKFPGFPMGQSAPDTYTSTLTQKFKLSCVYICVQHT